MIAPRWYAGSPSRRWSTAPCNSSCSGIAVITTAPRSRASLLPQHQPCCELHAEFGPCAARSDERATLAIYGLSHTVVNRPPGAETTLKLLRVRPSSDVPQVVPDGSHARTASGRSRLGGHSAHLGPVCLPPCTGHRHCNSNGNGYSTFAARVSTRPRNWVRIQYGHCHHRSGAPPRAISSSFSYSTRITSCLSALPAVDLHWRYPVAVVGCVCMGTDNNFTAAEELRRGSANMSASPLGHPRSGRRA